ncbi:MAG: hypothetical protein KAG61_09125, partial [Bacteriovoracaceae bacterium]|nr:hypothetical protein [Bacteriovoracaceae bacterium]
YDTLMQMGRWFGFRINYEDLCKVYMSDLMIDNFAGIITATEDLIKDFKDMSEAKKTPNDFGLAVKQHPDSALQITARNKQKNIQEFVFDMKLDGHSKETSWLSIVDKEKNLKCVESIVSKLSSISENEDVNGSILWRNIEASVISDFLNDFKVYKTDQLGLTARMPIAFIKKYVEKRNIKWDVALYSGMGARHKISTQKIKKEKRKVVLKGDYVEIKNRQVSSGNSESIALPSNLRKDLKSERKEIRANLKNPLLMLHVLEPEYIGESLKETSALAAFGISFPGDINSKGETIKLKINTVYYNNLLEAESGESSDD